MVRKIIKFTLITFGTLILIAFVWLALVIHIFTGVKPYTPDPVYSPDLSKVIIPTVSFDKNNYETYLLVQLKIQDTQTNEILFQIQTHASDRMRWTISWIDNETIKLDSSDIGSYCWSEENGIWCETVCP